MSVEPTRPVSPIAHPSSEALQRSADLARRALRAHAAFLWPAAAGQSVSLRSGETDGLETGTVRAMVLSSGAAARHDGGSHAWLAVPLRRGARCGTLCVAARAPRGFDDDDVAVLQAIGGLIGDVIDAKVETLEVETPGERSCLPLQALVDLSGTLLREAQDASPALPADTLLAAADSLVGVATRLRELSAPARRPAGAPDKRAAPRILLADDLDLNRRLIADMLSLDGHRVDCVADGAAAVRAVATERYDLVLMDMIMPEMDGLAATRAIRALPLPARDVPIVALTANSTRDQLDACIEAGMDAALTKPMSLDALTDAVARWTRGRDAA